MRIAVLSGGTGPHVQDLIRAGQELDLRIEAVDFRTMTDETLLRYKAVIVRTMPAGSLEQIVCRMDLLHEAEAGGVVVVNPPRAIEACVNKQLTTARLIRANIPTPRTRTVQTAEQALEAFEELGGDVVLKPLFGAEGRGLIRLSDREIAWRTLRCIEQIGGVLYLQEFVHHPGWDIRLFVLDGQVIGAMKRHAKSDWRTNVAQGGRAEAYTPTPCQIDLAVRSADAVGAVVSGVDLLPTQQGSFTCIEVNGVPGWAALTLVNQVDVARAIVEYTAMRVRR